MTAAEIAGYVVEVQEAGNVILGTVQALAPNDVVPAETAGVVLNLVAVMAEKALAGWSKAAGIPITIESIQALAPNPIPLTPPDPE